MPLYYRLSENHDPLHPAAYGKWYARPVHIDTIEVEQLSEQISANCTVKHADVVAVLSELTYVMTHELQASHRVHLRGLGTFKIGISSRGVVDKADFDPSLHVRSLHILFYPETTIDANGQRHQALLTGTQLRKLPARLSRLFAQDEADDS